METINNIEKLANKTAELVEQVRNGAASNYFSFYFGEDEESEEKWTIRVSNHKANPERVDANTISFVVVVEEEESEDDVYSPFKTNKKSFKSIPNQYVLNEDNCDENGGSIEDLIEYHLV